MAVSDYSTNPNSNTSIGGINIAENCPAPNINNALRQLMADVAAFAASVPNGGNYMPTAGGIFTGNPTYTGQGGYLHNSGTTLPGGTVTFLPQGSPLPAGQDGDMVVFYT